jgi:PAS domain-containing protein
VTTTRLLETVAERTAELRESEARYRSLTELASDWYWEQDENGHFTKVSGPVLEMLGMQVDPCRVAEPPALPGWNEAERETLRAIIAAAPAVSGLSISPRAWNGRLQTVSRQWRTHVHPVRASRFIGYRGIGVELTAKQ